MIERLELELTNIQHELMVNKYPTQSIRYITLVNRSNVIKGALAALRGEVI